jgi:hypothetical protein
MAKHYYTVVITKKNIVLDDVDGDIDAQAEELQACFNRGGVDIGYFLTGADETVILVHQPKGKEQNNKINTGSK